MQFWLRRPTRNIKATFLSNNTIALTGHNCTEIVSFFKAGAMANFDAVKNLKKLSDCLQNIAMPFISKTVKISQQLRMDARCIFDNQPAFEAVGLIKIMYRFLRY